MSRGESIREQIEEREREWLAPQAALSAESKGRRKPLEPDSLRTDFQRDRDRIIHSKAFRRLKHKTQVFLSPEGDHYRTRLTHTLEVSQISRTIARSLRLNEDLAEAIALGHDLGHTPFGHVGEGALTAALEGVVGRYPNVKVPFLHNEQSLRVVDFIEYDGQGLNLTEEVRDGILNHTGPNDPSTLEGRVVKIADRIAYVNHDVDDAIRAGVLSESDLPSHVIETLGRHQGQRIGALTRDMVAASEDLSSVSLSPDKSKAMNDLRAFLFKRVYENPFAKAEDPKAKRVLRALFDYYLGKPEQLPADFAPAGDEELPTKVCDYVAGMTDRFAIRTYQALYVPKSWMV